MTDPGYPARRGNLDPKEGYQPTIRPKSMLKVQKLRDQLGTRITITWSGRNMHRVRTWGGKKIKVSF